MFVLLLSALVCITEAQTNITTIVTTTVTTSNTVTNNVTVTDAITTASATTPTTGSTQEGTTAISTGISELTTLFETTSVTTVPIATFRPECNPVSEINACLRCPFSPLLFCECMAFRFECLNAAKATFANTTCPANSTTFFLDDALSQATALCEQLECAQCDSTRVCPAETGSAINKCGLTLGPCNDASSTKPELCGCLRTVRRCVSGVPDTSRCVYAGVLKKSIDSVCTKCDGLCDAEETTTLPRTVRSDANPVARASNWGVMLLVWIALFRC
jgi:hypothetical protein